MGELLTISAYARHRGVTTKAVRKAIDDGRIRRAVRMRGGQRRIHRDIADEDWRANTGPQGVPFPDRGGISQSQIALFPDADGDLDDEEGGDGRPIPSLTEWRQAREKEVALTARMRRLEMAGELVRVELVERLWFEVHRTLKEQLQTLAQRLAPEVMTLTDLGEVEAFIAREHNAALREIADAIERAVGGEEPPAREEGTG